MKVSIIVSIYNGADVLPYTIPPLLNQDYPHDLTEIILVDDASTDRTPSLLENPEWNDRCTVLRHDQNRGRTATRNSGMDAATGDLFVLLDCDIQVEPRFISQHVSRHEDDSVVGVLSNIQTREVPLTDKYHRYLFRKRRGAKLFGSKRPLPFQYFILGCSSIKSSAAKATGKFNEQFQGYGIDLEYAYRLWQNYPKGLFYSPEIVVYMHKVKSLNEALVDFQQWGQRNVPILLEKSPELSQYTGADFVSSPQGRFSPKTLLGTVFINGAMTGLAKILLAMTPYPLSNLLIRYLMVSATVTGYRKSLKTHG